MRRVLIESDKGVEIITEEEDKEFVDMVDDFYRMRPLKPNKGTNEQVG